MRIRTPFAGEFIPCGKLICDWTLTPLTPGALLFLLALSAYLGFSKVQIPGLNDKALHLLDFFALTVRMSV